MNNVSINFDIKQDKDFNTIPFMVLKHNPAVFMKIQAAILRSKPRDVKKYEYDVGNDFWTVYDAPTFKMTLNKSGTYKCFFDKLTGFNCRFGKTVDDDPEYCGLGPEIADIEIVTGSCPKVNSENCRWCYKNNTSAPGKVMTLEQFKQVWAKAAAKTAAREKLLLERCGICRGGSFGTACRRTGIRHGRRPNRVGRF